MVDQKRVLTNGPWNLFKNLLLLNEVDSDTQVYRMEFKMLELWVQIHNVPLACAEVIGNQIGNVTNIAIGLKGECWGKFLRVRVSIDISRPLKRVIRISL